MSGPLPGKGGIRAIFSSVGGPGKHASRSRRLAWLGTPEPGLLHGLAATGWETVQIPFGEDMAAAIGRTGVEVAVVDFGDGNDAVAARIEAAFAALPAMQWVALASEQALAHPRVCDLIHDQCFDFFIPPLGAASLARSLGHAWGKARLSTSRRGEVDAAQHELGLFGSSVAMSRVRERLRKFAGFDMPVLLTGETGTGKDVAARAIHAQSVRRLGPFVAINCGALPENLVQSELFGHERGAFTGANARKIGRIEAAEGGVVFLDEIGDLPLEAQCNLLRFLEAHTIERVGGTASIHVDARVIAATHVDLQEAVRAGRFREDLYYRLNVLHLHLPALREREADSVALARQFLDEFRSAHRARTRALSPAALAAIASHPWPGNVRELINRVHSAAVTADGRPIEPDDLGLVDANGENARSDLQAARAEIERTTIEGHLRATGFNMSESARRLNISRVTLYRLCRKYGIKASPAA